MDYQHAMAFLSDCDIGAVLIDSSTNILHANAAADRLLHGKGELSGLRLEIIAPALCETEGPPAYVNIGFGEYLQRGPAPTLPDLPPDTRLIVFQDATKDACHDMLLTVVNQMSEAMLLCDAEGRIWLLNDAAVKLDSFVTQDVQGDNISDVYTMLDGSEMAIPRVIRDRKPLLNLRQYYATRYGKRIDIVSNNYPVMQNGQILGAFNLMNDLHAVEELHKKIIDLQDKLLERQTAKSVQRGKKSPLAAQYHFSDIICRSPGMRGVVSQCIQAAKTDASIMIYGETGTGKELFAQSVHNASRRSNGPFLAINCAAIPENLLESLLFGTEKGAYTGAERRPGLFEQANGGTLLLDEINSMNISLQSKLLRVLQDGVVRRVGGATEIHVDVRVLSNTNMPPLQAVEENRLRRDLFYRLGVVNITVPPLRQRREDISLLTKHFIVHYNRTLARNVRDIDARTLECFRAYDWPGNVRELQHAIEHAMIILPDTANIITPDYLPEYIRGDLPAAGESAAANDPTANLSLQTAVKEYERQIITHVLQDHGGNITETARALQISRQNLQYYIKRHKITLD